MPNYRTLLQWLVIPALCLLGSPDGTAQSQATGIYFVFSEGRCLDNKVKKANAPGNICIPDKPLFTAEDFVEIDKPGDDFQSGSSYLTIRLSEAGSTQLAAITELYIGKQLALILDNKAVFLLAIERKITSGNIILNAPLRDPTLEATYRALIKLTAG